MQLYTVYLNLETALHVSGGTYTHHQERIQLYLQHLVFVTPLLLPGAIAVSCKSVIILWGRIPWSDSNQTDFVCILYVTSTYPKTTADWPDHDQQHCYHHAPTVKPEAVTAVVELLMMGMKTPKTCWAVHKCQVINLRSCCIWLVDLFEKYSSMSAEIFMKQGSPTVHVCH